MRFLHAFFGILLFATLLMAGALLMYGSVFGGEDFWQSLQVDLLSSRFKSFGAGATLVLLVLWYLVTGMSRRKQREILSFKGENGTVSISVKAIAGYLSRLADELPDVASLHPAISSHNGELDVQLDIRIRAGEHVAAVCESLQQRVRESMLEHLGVSRVRDVRVNVREFLPALVVRTEASPEPAAPAPEDEEWPSP